ncbi:MAG TPA: TIGR02587 family membrane protein [Thermomicrobiales bacterium]|nr:TIGR02587 family membrane protein [Thermomicrobiales bacterium]
MVLAQETSGWRRELASELDDFAHGAAGGFLFGIPLLYTMEFWFIGPQISMLHALILLGLSIGISLIFIATIGFREKEPPTWRDILAETIDAIGISLIVTVVTLFMLGKIDFGTPLDITTGTIAIELLPVSLGVAIANHILPRQEDRQGNEEDREAGKQAAGNATTRDVVASAGGALLLSLNIAPTDEVAVLAAELSELQLIGLLIFSLLITYIIVFQAGFRNQRTRLESEGAFQHPLTETIVAYLVALVVSGLTLWIVGALTPPVAFGTILSMTVVLAFPGALGAAAGRLAV